MPHFTIRHSSEMLQASIDGENREAAAAAAIICVLAHYGFDPAGRPAAELLADLSAAAKQTAAQDQQTTEILRRLE